MSVDIGKLTKAKESAISPGYKDIIMEMAKRYPTIIISGHTIRKIVGDDNNVIWKCDEEKESNMKAKHAVVSVSGGLDSTSLLLNLLKNGYKVHILNFDYGSKQNKIELEYLNKNLSYLRSKGFDIDYRTADISDAMGGLYRSSLTRDDIETPEGEYCEDVRRVIVVPNRNAIFASLTYGYALSIYEDTKEDVVISLGIHAAEGDNEYPDCTPEFFESIMKSFALGNYDSEHVTAYVPYAGKLKKEVLKDGIECCTTLGLDYKIIYANTLSCYSPVDGLACGKCATCDERLKSWEYVGLEDPAEYVNKNDNAINIGALWDIESVYKKMYSAVEDYHDFMSKANLSDPSIAKINNLISDLTTVTANLLEEYRNGKVQ